MATANSTPPIPGQSAGFVFSSAVVQCAAALRTLAEVGAVSSDRTTAGLFEALGYVAFRLEYAAEAFEVSGIEQQAATE